MTTAPPCVNAQFHVVPRLGEPLRVEMSVAAWYVGGMSDAVILFDGVCNLCHGTVRFVLPRDPRGHFRFASLQSDAGRALVLRFGRDPGQLDTVYVVTEAGILERSEAILEILRQLRAPWSWLAVARVLPRSWRDALYGFVARRRYAWFGRRDVCAMPEPGWEQRFLS